MPKRRLPGDRIGPETRQPSLRRRLYGDDERKVDAPAELAANQSPEFLARHKTILDIFDAIPGLGTPTPLDAAPTGPLADALEAITKFATKADRIKALEALQLEGRADETQKAIFEWFKRKFPRVMAHNNRVGVAPLDKGVRAINGRTTGIDKLLGRKGVSNITVDPGSKGKDFAEDLAHELTHTAQRLSLGEDRFGSLYNDFYEFAGYKNIPFEVSANKVGARKRADYEKFEAERPKTGVELREALKDRGYPQYDPSAVEEAAGFSDPLELLRRALGR